MLTASKSALYESISHAVLMLFTVLSVWCIAPQGHPKEQATFARVSGYVEQACTVSLA